MCWSFWLYRTVQKRIEPYRTVQHCTEPYSTVQNRTEPYGTVRNRAEPYRTVPISLHRPYRSIEEKLINYQYITRDGDYVSVSSVHTPTRPVWIQFKTLASTFRKRRVPNVYIKILEWSRVIINIKCPEH